MLERVWLCSPTWEALLPLRGQGAKLVDSTRLSRIKEGPERRAATLRENGIDAVNMHHTDWNGGMVALFHRFDRVAFGWDMQEPHILQAGLAHGPRRRLQRLGRPDDRGLHGRDRAATEDSLAVPARCVRASASPTSARRRRTPGRSGGRTGSDRSPGCGCRATRAVVAHHEHVSRLDLDRRLRVAAVVGGDEIGIEVRLRRSARRR